MKRDMDESCGRQQEAAISGAVARNIERFILNRFMKKKTDFKEVMKRLRTGSA
jgi:hypothetical protein